MTNSLVKRVLATILMFNTALLGFPTTALASPISTQTLIQLEARQAKIDGLQALLLRDDIQQSLISLGVAPQDAQQRVATLTDEELTALEQQLDSLPAGGDLLAVVGVVFVVLIILDLVGVTNVFTSITKI